MKEANTPTDRIGRCFEDARTAVVAKALGYRAIMPTPDVKSSQIAFLFGSYLSQEQIILESMVIACAGSMVKLNKFETSHADASDVMGDARRLHGIRADESEVLAEAQAAHVVCHTFVGHTMSAVSIDECEDYLGAVMTPLGESDVQISRETLISLAAGGIASAIGCPYIYPGDDDDYKQAHREARSLFGKLCGTSERIHNELKTARKRATKIVHKFWLQIIRVAESLLEFQWAAMQIPRFNAPLETLDDHEVHTPILPFTGETNDEFPSSLQKKA